MHLTGLYHLVIVSPFQVGDKRSGKTCRLDQRVRLHHVDTGGYRHKHDEIYAKMDHTNLGFQVSYFKKKKKKNIVTRKLQWMSWYTRYWWLS